MQMNYTFPEDLGKPIMHFSLQAAPVLLQAPHAELLRDLVSVHAGQLHLSRRFGQTHHADLRGTKGQLLSPSGPSDGAQLQPEGGPNHGESPAAVPAPDQSWQMASAIPTAFLHGASDGYGSRRW